jgi:hypothetical protein
MHAAADVIVMPGFDPASISILVARIDAQLPILRTDELPE